MTDLFSAVSDPVSLRKVDMSPITIVVEGEPQGKGRPRASSAGGFVRMYTPSKTKGYEAEIAYEASQAMLGRDLMRGPVRVELEMYHSIRKSWAKAKREAAALNKIVPTIKVDADNCLKVFCDALNGVVWVDDVQVVDASIKKRFADEPCVLLRVFPLDLGSA